MSKSPTLKKTNTNRLPDEHIQPVTIRSMIVMIAGTMVLLVAINAGAIMVLRHLNPNRFMVIIEKKWDIINQNQGPDVNLILGDSSANQGADPEQFRERLGGRWVNLGTMANLMLLDDAWMLQQYIDLHGPPTRVVLMHVPGSFHRVVHGNAFAQVPLPWGYWDQVQPRVPLRMKQKLEIAMARYAPLYASNQSLSAVVMRPGEVARTQPPVRDDGFMPILVGTPARVVEDIERTNKEIQERESAISALNREALDTILDLAKTHGFSVYLAYGPMYDEFWAMESTQQRFAELHRELQAIAQQRSALHLVLDEPIRVPMSDLADTLDHLILPAAQRYSRHVANQIAAIESTRTTP